MTSLFLLPPPLIEISQIHALLGQPVGEEPLIMLSDVPFFLGWNSQGHLSNTDDCAIVFVAYGSLAFTNIIISRRTVPSFSVSIELLHESDRKGMQCLLDMA